MEKWKKILLISLGTIIYWYMFISIYNGIIHYNNIMKIRYIWENYTTFDFIKYAFFEYGFYYGYKGLFNDFSNSYIGKNITQFIIIIIFVFALYVFLLIRIILYNEKRISKVKAFREKNLKKKQERKLKKQQAKDEAYRNSNEYKIEQLQKELEQLKKEKEKEQ